MKEILWPERIDRYSKAIRRLEEPNVGLLRFTSIGLGEGALHVSMRGWEVFQDLCALPELGKFASDLDAACAPIVAAYAKRLRQHLANECIELAEKSLAARDRST